MNKHKQILSDEELEIERLEFHKWANFYCHSIDRDFDGNYKFDTTHDLWESWQSAVASYKGRLSEQEPVATLKVGSSNVPFTPKTASEMRSFIRMHFDSLQYANPETEDPDEMDRYTLTIHDLLSAFDWAGHYDCDHIPDASKMIVPDGYMLVPIEADQALLVSMATCLNHGFGLLAKEDQDNQLYVMRKLHSEVVGKGYYSQENRERYLSMLEASPKYTGDWSWG